ncbi:TetR/AcrR family transcriptional regulator [uncultured Roseobacter sp.]|uniref:TetR/AcrR family transcriptional regulator n=1 Tax=uncultured Roseobacter sp. TaxID=114847 RepID=UPI002625FCAA|nr:TetR/AcrR family transcriptional regulator [uncultured Roseobacter sp.]
MSRERPLTRERIVNAALALLGSERRDATRLSDIAKKAGVSRQAIYLHFGSRAEVLIAATKALDAQLDMDSQLQASRTAPSGRVRLEAFVLAWCSYVPKIYRVAKPLMDMAATDTEAASAWSQRMSDMREGCAAAIQALHGDGDLPAGLDPEIATDLMWSMLLVTTWEDLVLQRGWTQSTYENEMVAACQRLFVA